MKGGHGFRVFENKVRRMIFETQISDKWWKRTAENYTPWSFIIYRSGWLNCWINVKKFLTLFPPQLPLKIKVRPTDPIFPSLMKTLDIKEINDLFQLTNYSVAHRLLFRDLFYLGLCIGTFRIPSLVTAFSLATSIIVVYWQCLLSLKYTSFVQPNGHKNKKTLHESGVKQRRILYGWLQSLLINFWLHDHQKASGPWPQQTMWRNW